MKKTPPAKSKIAKENSTTKFASKSIPILTRNKKAVPKGLNIFTKPNGFSSYKKGDKFPCEYIEMRDKMHIRCKVGDNISNIHLSDLFTTDTLSWLSWKYRNEKSQTTKSIYEFAYNYILLGYESSTKSSYKPKGGIGADENKIICTKKVKRKK